MNLAGRMLAFIAVASAAPAAAQQSPSEDYARHAAALQSQVSGLYKETLTPEKAAFRAQLVVLRDSLSPISAVTSRMERAHAAGTSAVVLSGGHWLQRYCRTGAAMADATNRHVASLATHDAQGDRALAAFRMGLTALNLDLVQCERADSALVSQRNPDQVKLIAVGNDASAAITRFDLIRDNFLKLLGTSMPTIGTH